VRITLSCPYEVEVRQPRKRGFATVLNRSTFEVNVDETPTDVAHLVCEIAWAGASESLFRKQSAEQGERPSKLYEIGGKFYVENCSVDELLADPMRRGLENPFDVAPRGREKSGALLGRRDDEPLIPYDEQERKRIAPPAHNLAGHEIAAHYGSEYAEILDDGGAQVRLLAAARAAELRVVDGFVCSLVSEPRLLVDMVIKPKQEGQVATVKMRISAVESAPELAAFTCPSVATVGRRSRDGKAWAYQHEHAVPFFSGDMTFALDRHAAAANYAQQIARSSLIAADCSRWGGSEVTVSDEVDLLALNPTFLREDASDALVRVSDELMKIGARIMFLPDEAIAAWADLRDLSRLKRYGGSEIAEAMRRFAQAAGDAGDAERIMAEAVVAEYDAALAAGRAWVAPAPVADSVADNLAAWQGEGWNGVPHEAIERLSEEFTPGIDRLVRVRVRMEAQGKQQLPFAEAAFVFGGMGDCTRPLAQAAWGDTDGLLTAMRDLATTHAKASLERAMSLLAEDSLTDLPNF